MSHKTILASIITCIAAPAFVGAQELGGDAQAGDQLFNRQCVACHVVADPDGNVLAGRNARTGPNLYAIDGRVLGGIEDFRYSDGLVALGAEGAVWDEASFVGFVQDATGWVREATGRHSRSQQNGVSRAISGGCR